MLDMISFRIIQTTRRYPLDTVDYFFLDIVMIIAAAARENNT